MKRRRSTTTDSAPPMTRLEKFLARAAAEGGREPPRLDRRALDALLRHDWPGNVRELENEMRRLAAVAGESIRLEDLSPQVRSGAGAAAATSGGGAGAPVAGPPLTLEEAERRAILAALEAASGNKVRAAEILGIPRTSLYHRLKKLGL
ncbi:MAG: hypothetical protein HYY76_00905 [Acidobacteria bacterium]|nr:hypothetical protein [Acidobacteriota bacterium]